VIVSPEDDVEIRRINLTNRSIRNRRLNLTSYVELSMAPHNSDRQHPAFNKLFIQTEAVPQHQSLLAFRRPRTKDDLPIVVAHRITIAPSEDETMRFETDRQQFIGRGRTLANPMGVFQELGNSQGFVLDPILSLRKSVTLSPGQHIQVSLVLAAGETHQQVLGLMDKYSDPHAIERAMDSSWASAQIELRLLPMKLAASSIWQATCYFPILFCVPHPNALKKTTRVKPGCGHMESLVTCRLPWLPSARHRISAWSVRCSRHIVIGGGMG
jgi:cyclic beta-1,2-glucan synthetase